MTADIDEREARLRSLLHAEADRLPLRVDGALLRERLEHRPQRHRLLPRMSPMALGTAATITVAVAVVAGVLLLAPGLSRPAWPAPAQQVPPAHVVAVKAIANLGIGTLVDPSTLSAVEGAPTVQLGQHYASAVSPDGQTLAVIRWPRSETIYAGGSGTNQGGELHLINLDNGSDRDTGIRINTLVNALTYTSDGTALVWTEADAPFTDWQVMRYRIDGVVEQLTSLPTGDVPSEWRLLPTGDLLVFAIEASDANPSLAGKAHLLLITGQGQLVRDISLPSVHAGQRQLRDGTFRIDTPALAWDLDRGWLYIVHADEDAVTIVDLARREVSAEVDARPSATAWQRLLGVGVAAAKLEPGTSRSAALSPDGTHLYVVGARQEMVGSGSSSVYREVPLGGFIFDTQSRSRVGEISMAVDHVLSAPGGMFVFSAAPLSALSGQTGTARLEVVVTDPQLVTRARQVLPGSWTVLGLSPDSSHLYVAGWNGDQRSLVSWNLDGLRQDGTLPGYALLP